MLTLDEDEGDKNIQPSNCNVNDYYIDKIPKINMTRKYLSLIYYYYFVFILLLIYIYPNDYLYYNITNRYY